MSHPNKFMFFGDEDFSEILKRIIREVLSELLKDENSPYPSRKEGSNTKVYSRNEVAAILKKSPNTVSKYIRQKKLHASVFNGVYYINEKELVSFINDTAL